MSAAKPIPHSAVLGALSVVALLGFWMGFKDSYNASGGIKACRPDAGITLPGGQPVPLATPISGSAPPPVEDIKPAEPEKKKPEPVKADTDPGTEQHDLPAKPAPVIKAPEPVKPPAAETPPSDPSQQPPPY